MPDWNYHGLCPELLRAVEEEGWLLPTPIQDEAIPAILGGGDVCGAAETGSGKTAAFVLPILQLVQEELVNAGAMSIVSTGKNYAGKNTGKCQNEMTSAKRAKRAKRAKSAKSAKSTNDVTKSTTEQSSVTLSVNDRDTMLAVSQPDQLVCQSRSERQWQGVRATCGVTKGAKVCFEATVEDDGLCRVGWSTMAAKYDVGTDSQSWGFGGTGKRSHGRKFITYGRAFGRGDVIGCYLDMSGSDAKSSKGGKVSFSLNGEMLGVAYDNVPLQKTTILFPSCVLKNAQMKFEFQNMKYSSPETSDYTPIGKADHSHLRWGNSGNNGGGGSGGGGSGGGGSSSSSSSTKDDCRAIIMAPTRDLAAQIHSWVHKLCKYFNNPPLHASLIVGGNDGHQQRSMDKAHILIGTCGRLKDMLIKKKVRRAPCTQLSFALCASLLLFFPPHSALAFCWFLTLTFSHVLCCVFFLSHSPPTFLPFPLPEN